MVFLWGAFVLSALDMAVRYDNYTPPEIWLTNWDSIGKDDEKGKPNEDNGDEGDDDDDIKVTDKTKDDDERSEAASEGREKGVSSGSDYGDEMEEVDLTDRE